MMHINAIETKTLFKVVCIEPCYTGSPSEGDVCEVKEVINTSNGKMYYLKQYGMMYANRFKRINFKTYKESC